MRVWDCQYEELGQHKRILLQNLHPRIWYDACKIINQDFVLQNYQLLPPEVVAFYKAPGFLQVAKFFTTQDLIESMQHLLDRMNEEVRPLVDIYYDKIEDYILRLKHFDDVLMRRHHPAHYMPGDDVVDVVPLVSNGHAG